MRKMIAFLMLCMATLALPVQMKGQAINEYEIKAVFIYNFTQFTQWPEDSFESPDDKFVIGILGENVFGKLLEEAVAGEHYQSRPIVVEYYPTLKDVRKCHILYVGSTANPGRLAQNSAVLTIGEREDFMTQKGILRFYNEGNRIRIEINQARAAAVGLSISSKLLRLATIYREK
jgi:hypothetical protein